MSTCLTLDEMRAHTTYYGDLPGDHWVSVGQMGVDCEWSYQIHRRGGADGKTCLKAEFQKYNTPESALEAAIEWFSANVWSG